MPSNNHNLNVRDNQAFLQLVRHGVGHSADPLRGSVDWDAIEALAYKQGLLGVLIEGIEKIPEPQRPPKQILLLRIGDVMEGYEKRFWDYRSSLAELAAFYDSHGYKMMVLKGYACGMNWPKSEHRPCGDIDIWMFGKQKEADALLEKTNTNHTDDTNDFKIDKSHHHHTVFNWMGFTVENHYDFENVHHHKSSVELEKVFKELGKDDSHFVEIEGASTGSATRIYLPSPNHHALLLLKNSMTDFAAFYDIFGMCSIGVSMWRNTARRLTGSGLRALRNNTT